MKIKIKNGYIFVETDTSEKLFDNLRKGRELDVKQVVVFMNTTGDVFNPNEQRQFEEYVGSGVAMLAIHSACDTEHEYTNGRHEWPWIHEYVGAFFLRHPMPHNTQIMRISDREHPSTAHLPERWSKHSEWYSFVYHRSMANNRILIDLTYDSTEEPAVQANYNNDALRTIRGRGYNHPFCWCHERLPGRMFYTSLGHMRESYQEDPLFIEHVEKALMWCANDA